MSYLTEIVGHNMSVNLSLSFEVSDRKINTLLRLFEAQPLVVDKFVVRTESGAEIPLSEVSNSKAILQVEDGVLTLRKGLKGWRVMEYVYFH